MSTSIITQHAAGTAAAAAAVVAIALGGVAFAIAHDSGGAVVPTDPGQSAVAPLQHGGHYEYTAGGGKLVGGP
jgi:hypothetical protein